MNVCLYLKQVCVLFIIDKGSMA